jgi:hypothetical protein
LTHTNFSLVYDKHSHEWVVQDSAPQKPGDKYSEYIFTICRQFDYDHKHTDTLLNIKSSLLKYVLRDIIGDVRGISLIEDYPSVDPKQIFNYYEEIAEWHKVVTAEKRPDHTPLEKAQEKALRKKRLDPVTGEQIAPLTEEEKKLQTEHVKLLIDYLDKDFDATRGKLHPMIANNTITFDLLWALFKPNTIIYTQCAGSNEPRAFKCKYSEKVETMRGTWWAVEGQYLEYDGTTKDPKHGKGGSSATFGWGSITINIEAFKGARKITSLACYPMKYRNDEAQLRTQLIERGKKFVSLAGMQYKAYEGLAFVKKKRQYVKVHVGGRIMVDSATFRRINPNYVVSSVKAIDLDADKDQLVLYLSENSKSHLGTEEESDSEDEEDKCGCAEMEEEEEEEEERKRSPRKRRYVYDENTKSWQELSKEDQQKANLKLGSIDGVPKFSDEDYLIAASVVLGWAFTEKLWLEFPVAYVKEIVWDDKAYESLVLPEEQKMIVRALVETHSGGGSNAPKTIDDVITGKGRGLVCVLHGPPGVGKTLTAEGISELLRRPLYCVSSGELGTNPGQLESELQKILDIAQQWGAVLLLDEADVFLERRNTHDLHRNALVSIFLRLLEYFQGIMFLTTNRVETFDEAFQSRIHVALRYNSLELKAKRIIWNTFLGKVANEEERAEGVAPREIITQEQLDNICWKDLNGRQVCCH